MYCTQCGFQLRDEDLYCARCSVPARPEARRRDGSRPRLVRVLSEKKIAGVCAGFARYFDVDVVLIRVIWLAAALTTGVGFIAYLVAWMVMPKELPAEQTLPAPAGPPAAPGVSA
ncbi:MAG: PspC domain-containing protein [Bryobacterales bacterium]|nr:PspC domain-containing protein [Bryobacteraceae bacterium]MDW8353645.1 PspC domain-containing protein [Bryobacterales bacterium]